MTMIASSAAVSGPLARCVRVAARISTERRLPQERTSFVGRKRELEQLDQQLGNSGWVTVVGPPGVGKTRLALRYARLAEPRHRGGCWFLDLAGSNDESELLAVLCAELGIVGTADHAHVSAALLARSPLLIIFDNFEQMTEGAGRLLGELVEGIAGLSSIVTSRRPVGIPGEHLLELSPLCTEDAVRLLQARGRAVAPDLEPDAESEYQARLIVDRLDSLPLAIELAAARLNVLSIHELRQRLDHRLSDVLSRASPDTRRTLSGAIEWSWSLLSPLDRQVLIECTIFSAGFTLEAAEAVLAYPGGPRVLDALQSLREQSLMWSTEPSRPLRDKRFVLYEAVREFALERRLSSPQRSELAEQHAQFFLSRAQHFARAVHGPRAAYALAWLNAERMNVIAALKTCLATCPAVAAKLALTLAPLAQSCGAVPNYCELLDQALGAVPEREEELKVCLKLAMAEHLQATGKLVESARVLAEMEPPSAPRLLAKLAGIRGEMARMSGERETAVRELTASIQHLAEADPVERAVILGRRSLTYWELGQAAAAWEDARLSAEICGAHASPSGLARALCYMSLVRIQTGQLAEAQELVARAMRIHGEVGDRRGEVRARLIDGMAITYAPRYEEALGRFRVVADIAGQLGDAWCEATALGFVAMLLAITDRDEPALCERARAQMVRLGEKTLIAAVLLVDLLTTLAAIRRYAAAGKLDRARALLASLSYPPPPELVVKGGAQLQPILRMVDENWRLTQNELFVARATSASRAIKPEITIGPDGRWFRPAGGTRVDLSRRRSMRLILLALVEARTCRPGQPSSLEQMIEAGWPGERIASRSGINRAYVALSWLRKIGLQGVLLTRDNGYLIDPETEVLRVPEAGTFNAASSD